MICHYIVNGQTIPIDFSELPYVGLELVISDIEGTGRWLRCYVDDVDTDHRPPRISLKLIEASKTVT